MNEEKTMKNGPENKNTESEKVDFRQMSDEQLDTALADARDADASTREEQNTAESAADISSEPDLMPTDDFTPDDLADIEPMQDFELDNLRYALAESPQGVEVWSMAENTEHFDPRDGFISQTLYDKARSAGVSDAQIDGFRKSQQVQLNNAVAQVLTDAGISPEEHHELIRFVDENFSQDEREIFEREAGEDPAKSLRTLKAYHDLEAMR